MSKGPKKESYEVGPETKAKINDLAMKMKATNGPLEGAQLEQFNQKRVHPQLMVQVPIFHFDLC